MPYLKSSQVQKMLHIAKSTLHRLVKTDLKFPTPTRVGRNLLFNYDEIQEYLKRNKDEYEKKCKRFY